MENSNIQEYLSVDSSYTKRYFDRTVQKLEEQGGNVKSDHMRERNRGDNISGIDRLYNEGRQLLSQNSISEDLRKDEIRAILRQLSDAYHCSTRFFLINWLEHSKWRKQPVRSETKYDYYVRADQGKGKRYFCDMTPEQVEQLDDLMNEKYREVLADIAFVYEKDREIQVRIQRILKTAFQSHKKKSDKEKSDPFDKKTKIHVMTKDDALLLSHALRMSYVDATRFLYKSVEDGEWDFRSGSDQIHRYAFLRELGLKNIGDLEVWYTSKRLAAVGTEPEEFESEGNITRRLADNTSEIEKMTEEEFKNYLSMNGKSLSAGGNGKIPSRTAARLMRNLAWYYVSYGNGTLEVDTGSGMDTVKVSDCSADVAERNFKYWIRDFCLDQNKNVKSFEELEKGTSSDKEFWKRILNNLMTSLMRDVELSPNLAKDKPHQYLRTLSFDKENIHLEFLKDHLLNTFLEIEPVRKKDLLFMLFICCNLSWSQRIRKNQIEDGSYTGIRFRGFIYLADTFLNVAFLPKLYLPAAMEIMFISSILDADDYPPIVVYENFCDFYAVTRKREAEGKKK